MSESTAVATGQTDVTTPLVRIKDLKKSFGGVRALKGVDFRLLPGEVHALLGENGAGKSTLIKILAGVQSRDSGALEVYGNDTSFRSPAESRDAGLAVVYQDLSLAPSMTVAANLFLGREPRTALGIVKRREIMARTKEFLAEYGFPLNPNAVVGNLPFAYRQMTEIAKALISNVRILVLDEPTSALTEGEEVVLFDAIRNVTARGVGVVYVTHRLSEVFRLSQRVTVLRDGSNVGTYRTTDIDMKSLVHAIVGPGHDSLIVSAADMQPATEASKSVTGSPGAPQSAPAVQLSAVTNDKLRGVDLTVESGEIVGLAGVIGSGRTEILETIFGLRKVGSGQLQINGNPVKLKNPYQAIRLGVALAPEDRHEQGLVLSHSIERNIAMPRLPLMTRLGMFKRKASVKRSREAIKELAIKATGPSTVLSTLSGGNQQKVVFGKWRDPQPTLLLLDEPTVGVDVGAREEIYGVVRRTAQAGAGVLVVSSDLNELLLLCQRIALVQDGRIVGSVPRSDIANEEGLHHLVHTARSLAQEPTP